MLLIADLHLTDAPAEEYRWDVFKHVEKWCVESKNKVNHTRVGILGDWADRKDRHSGTLANRMLDTMASITEIADEVIGIMGNHDRPMTGKPFWNILNKLPNVSFIEKPWYDRVTKQLWLPYTNDFNEWDFSKWPNARVIFMHDTVTNAYVHHRKFTNDKMPPLPRDIPIYAGDIHHPQTINGNFTYVGAPHPVRFGDDHPCRMLEIDDRTYEIVQEIKLPSIEKRIITVASLDDLQDLQVVEGDQVRVRLSLKASRVSQWAEDERAVLDWAKNHGVEVASVEALIETESKSEFNGRGLGTDEEIFDEFCEAEGLIGDLRNAGLQLLQKK